MTGQPAKIYQPFKYNGKFLGVHEFFVAQVDWDWRHPYHDDADYAIWDAMWEAIGKSQEKEPTDQLYKMKDPEAKACNRWLLDHLPEVFHWLNIENRVNYYVRSNGDSEQKYNRNGKMISSSSWTVACICIFDEKDATAFRLRWV